MKNLMVLFGLFAAFGAATASAHDMAKRDPVVLQKAASVAQAEAKLLLKCEVHSRHMGIQKTVEVSKEVDVRDERGSLSTRKGAAAEDLVVLRWSLTECDDQTEIKFLAADYVALQAGEQVAITGRFKHDEPAFQLVADISCQLP